MSRQSPRTQRPSSTSPSKPSLRSTGSGGGGIFGGTSRSLHPQTRAVGLGLLPSPSFERTTSPKTVGFDETVLTSPGGPDGSLATSVAVEEDSIEAGKQQNTLLHTSLEPFFTLVHDGLAAEHYHPTVHYIFADDEEGPELVSEAVLRVLGRLDGNLQARKDENGGAADADWEGASTTFEEHVLILDVGVKTTTLQDEGGRPDYEVIQAQSLSADWQISSCGIENAPTMSEDDADAGLMLKIEGRGVRAEEPVGPGRESLEEMVGRYQRSLQEIRRMAAMGDEASRIED